jgi:subtilisin family serine protease
MNKTTKLHLKLGSALVALGALVVVALTWHPVGTITAQPQTPPKSTSLSTASSQTPIVKPSQSPSSSNTSSFHSPVTEKKDASGAMVITSGTNTYPIRRYKTLSVNDPYGSQWWTQKTGLETAWTVGAGSTPTTVAVIDTGFALNHEEFTNRWALNSGEQGATTSEAPSKLNCTDQKKALDQSCNLIDDNHDGIVDNESGPTTVENPSQLNCTDQGLPLDKSCNLIDDDGNGYVDDVRGWDFANYDNNVQAGEVDPNGSSTTHATEVTGVLAATGNNGKGIAGVNWATKILPLQAINDDGYGDTFTVSQAVRYAADRKVDVISLSLGTSADDPYLRQAIQYALSKGTIVVAASGNDGCDCISYPANYPEVIAVGAESSQGGPDSFSSYGSQLDLLGPGDNITSSTWSASNPTSAYVSGIAGTSFATPYVSGLLSLARSYQPTASWGELTNALLAQARHGSLTTTAPFSSTLGSGYAEADTLISRVSTVASPAMRYLLGPQSTNGTLSSALVYQCQSGDFPSAPVYQMTKGATIRYTISKLEQSQLAASGWTVKQVWYSCVGLPTDTPGIIRTINLLSEVNNSSTTKQTPAN